MIEIKNYLYEVILALKIWRLYVYTAYLSPVQTGIHTHILAKLYMPSTGIIVQRCFKSIGQF